MGLTVYLAVHPKLRLFLTLRLHAGDGELELNLGADDKKSINNIVGADTSIKAENYLDNAGAYQEV